MSYEVIASYFYTGAAFLHWGFVSPEDLPLKKTPKQPTKIDSKYVCRLYVKYVADLKESRIFISYTSISAFFH